MKDNNTKNIKKAVALTYESDYIAPKIIAKGKGLVADNIIKKAKDKNITLYEDQALVENLLSLNINDDIPEELYEAVAEILLYIYNLDAKRGREID